MIEVTITLGIIFSLFSLEIFGLAAGGLVVPGYIALQLSNPERVAGTFVISFLTFLIIRTISTFTFLYGRRQMVVSLLIGCLLANFSRYFLTLNFTTAALQLQAIGWVIPGLIANWFVKQGVFKTIAVLLVTSILVRFIVILLFNGAVDFASPKV